MVQSLIKTWLWGKIVIVSKPPYLLAEPKQCIRFEVPRNQQSMFYSWTGGGGGGSLTANIQKTCFEACEDVGKTPLSGMIIYHSWNGIITPIVVISNIKNMFCVNREYWWSGSILSNNEVGTRLLSFHVLMEGLWGGWGVTTITLY